MDHAQLRALWQDSLPRGALDPSDLFFTVRPRSLAGAPRAQTTGQASGDTELEVAEIAPAVERPAPPASGSTALRVLEEIGRGGMGVVFRARQESLEREVAVKKLRLDRLRDDQRFEFLAEARLTGGLSHPNIVPVYDLGVDERGQPMLVMKRVEGWSWSELLAARRQPAAGRERVLKLTDHLGILIQICDALSFAHARDIVHLDLKPDNIMIGEYGEVLLMDWGIALAVGGGDAPSGIPHKSSVAGPRGTPAYFAPELARGDGDAIGPRTDVYLLGALLYQVLQGNPPHDRGDLMSAIMHAVEHPAPKVTRRGAPRELRRLCQRAMAGDPAKRLASPRAFQSALKAYLEHRESALICERAEETEEACRARLGERLNEDERNRLYADFAEVVAGYSQALLLWKKNKRARSGQLAARKAYAEAALSYGDLGLAEAQAAKLPAGSDDLGELREAITAGRRRLARTRRAARLALVGGTVAALAIVGGLWLYARLRRAEQERLITAQKLEIAGKEALLIEAERARAQESRRRVQEALASLFSAQDAARRGLRARQIQEPIDRFLELSGRSLESLMAAAEIYLRLGDFHPTELLVNEANERFPLRPEPVAMTIRLRQEAEPERPYSIEMRPELYQQILDGRLPESELTLYLLGQQQKRAGDVAGALATLTRVEQYSQNFASMYYMRGWCHLELKDREAALSDFRRAAFLEPNSVPNGLALSSLLLRTGQTREAHARLSRLLLARPRAAEAHSMRALASERLGDQRAAEAGYSQAIEFGEPDHTLHGARAVVRMRLGRFAEAIADLDQGLELNPDDPILLENRGVARAQSGDLAGALVDFDRASAVAPKRPRPHLNRGKVLRELGKLDEARRAVKAALELDNRDPIALYEAALLDLLQSRFAEAEAGFSRALNAAPNMPRARLDRARARWGLGKREAARLDLRAILEQSPQSRLAPQARALLEQLDKAP